MCQFLSTDAVACRVAAVLPALAVRNGGAATALSKRRTSKQLGSVSRALGLLVTALISATAHAQHTEWATMGLEPIFTDVSYVADMRVTWEGLDDSNAYRAELTVTPGSMRMEWRSPPPWLPGTTDALRVWEYPDGKGWPWTIHLVDRRHKVYAAFIDGKAIYATLDASQREAIPSMEDAEAVLRGRLEPLGEARVNGVLTTKYRWADLAGAMGMGGASRSARDAPGETLMWIDERGIVMRCQIVKQTGSPRMVVMDRVVSNVEILEREPAVIRKKGAFVKVDAADYMSWKMAGEPGIEPGAAPEAVAGAIAAVGASKTDAEKYKQWMDHAPEW